MKDEGAKTSSTLPQSEDFPNIPFSSSKTWKQSSFAYNFKSSILLSE